jgi:hypothetical protein
MHMLAITGRPRLRPSAKSNGIDADGTPPVIAGAGTKAVMPVT